MAADPEEPLNDAARLAAVRSVAQHGETAFDTIVEIVRVALGVPVALVSLVDAERQFFAGVVGLPEPWLSRRETPLSHSFCRFVALDRAPLVIRDARRDPRLSENLAIRELSVIAYAGWPLITADGVTLGSICAIDSQPRTWTDDDLRFLELAAGLVIELVGARADASARVEADRRSADRDAVFRRVQARLLPREFLDTERVELAASFRPMGGEVLVGGDFYDVFECHGGGLLAVVGDVCGKGPEAAAIGATVRSLLRGAGRHVTDVQQLTTMVNDELLSSRSSRFVTMVLAHLQPHQDGTITICVAVAGHAPPVIRRATGATEALPWDRPTGGRPGAPPLRRRTADAPTR